MKEPMISVAEALSRVLAAAAPLPAEEVALADAFGRTLAAPVAAGRTQPPFANSAMDGYALRAADAAAPGARLRVIGESAAGRGFSGALRPGEATRIFTGAPLPEGADAIALQEDARRDGDFVVLGAPARPGDHVRTVGIDFREGAALLPAGRRLGPRDVALIAAANHPTASVHRKPRVAILATGDELRAPGETLGPAEIVASNNFFVMGLARGAGAEAVDLGVAPDRPEALAERIRAAQEARADVLVTLGGASVGDYDLVQKALVDAGMELGFWRIAMRPGKPLMFGRIGNMLALGLPGNPTSSAVCGVLFLAPLLRALQGDPRAGRDASEPARLAVALPENGARQDFMRATLAPDGAGGYVATPAQNQDSSLVRTLAEADALIIRAPHAPPARAGEACRILRLAPLGA
jgi:molybdopterin molybdotransferase